MHRSKHGAGTTAQVVTDGDGVDTAAVWGRVSRSWERNSRESETAGRSGSVDLRDAKHATRARNFARRVLWLEETIADLCQRGPSCWGALKSEGISKKNLINNIHLFTSIFLGEWENGNVEPLPKPQFRGDSSGEQ